MRYGSRWICCASAKGVYTFRFDSGIVLVSNKSEGAGKHRDNRNIRRERGKQVIVVIQDEETGIPVKGILDKRKK